MENCDFSKALVAAAREMKHPKFDRVNAAFRQGGQPSRYASLGALLDAVRPVYAKHGIAVVQSFGGSDGILRVTTELVHESGNLRTDSVSVPMPQNPQQAMALATYFRRAQLSAIAGVVGDDDDDGNTAAEEPQAPRREIPDAELAERVEAVRRRQGVEAAISGKKKPSGDLVSITGVVSKVYENPLPKGGFVYKVQLEDGPKLTAWDNLEGVTLIAVGKQYEFRCTVKDGKYGVEHTVKDFHEVAAPQGVGEDIPF